MDAQRDWNGIEATNFDPFLALKIVRGNLMSIDQEYSLFGSQ